MAKPRKQKLKVFRTPIGFHDAYVAAPSQKAALEAWGAESNLFGQGIAEQVTAPELTAEPLERPGEVVRRLRGSAKEQLAAVARTATPKRGNSPTPAPPLKGRGSRPRKPSRAELDAAEAALEEAEARQQGGVREIEREIAAIERRRRELLRRHEAERDELTQERDRARSRYERAMRAWDKAQ